MLPAMLDDTDNRNDAPALDLHDADAGYYVETVPGASNTDILFRGRKNDRVLD